MSHTCRALLMIGVLIAVLLPQNAIAGESEAIYQRRIVPLLQADRPSSCGACHFRGVKLTEFFHEDAAETFAELRSRGWIDVKEPKASKILGFLAKKKEGVDEQSLEEKVRKQEFEAVQEWIVAAAKEPALTAKESVIKNELTTDADLMQHSRFDQVNVRFIEAMWSQFGRCINCHSPLRNKKLVEEHGESISWMVPNDPQATLMHLREAELIDIEHPEESLIRTKPTALVEHGGGPKFLVDSETDAQWLAFLRDYAKTVKVKDGYQAKDVLPERPRRSWLSELQIRITGIPQEYAEKHLAVKIWKDGTSKDSRDSVVAIAESSVNVKDHVWQNAFTIYAMSTTENKTLSVKAAQQPLEIADSMPEGKYVVEVSLREIKNSDRVLGRASVQGPWPPGYQPPKIMDWKEFK